MHLVKTRQVPSLIGAEEFEKMNEEIVTQLNGSGFTYGSKEYVQAYDQAVIGRMLQITQNPQMFDRMMSLVGPAAQLYDDYSRYAGRKEQTKTGTGNTTTTTTYEDE